MKNPNEYLPLNQTTFLILGSLLPGPRHGYAIGKDVEALSDGQIRIAVGNLYVALKRLLDEGLIERAGDKEEDGERRKLYRLTAVGASVVQLDADRLFRTASRVRALGGSVQGV